MANTPSQALEIEVLKLFELVRKMRTELAQVRPGGEPRLLDTAADQLLTISNESTEASKKIRAACAKIKETGEFLSKEIKYTGARAIFKDVIDNSERIIDACRFHDSLAERIAGTVRTINAVEGTLNSLVVTLGDKNFQGLPTAIAEVGNDDAPKKD
ncbi:MAG: hypothetical protein O2944_06250 [Proteobacteria bacterium]|nr:hypothetical protein [Pseudomonadota bacterium]